MSDTKNTPQEIDLIELFGNIWNWITKIFLNVLYFFLRNAVLFIISGILSIGIGYTIYKATQPFYKSELLAYSHTISSSEIIQAINNWNFQNEFSELELENIKSISAQYLLDLNNDGRWDIVEDDNLEEVTDTATINKRISRAFCIRVELYDTTLATDIKEKVFLYLEKNPRVKDINKIRIQQKEAMIPKLEKEINDLDSLKNLQYFEDRNDNGKAGDLMILNEKELKLFHQEIIGLYSRQQAIERELFLSSEPFEITQDFTLPRVQENSIINILISSIKFGMIFSLLFVLLWDRRKQIKQLFEDSK